VYVWEDPPENCSFVSRLSRLLKVIGTDTDRSDMICYCWSMVTMVLSLCTVEILAENCEFFLPRIMYLTRGVYPRGGWESNLPHFLKWGVEGLRISTNLLRLD